MRSMRLKHRIAVVAGGAEIYALALPLATRMFLTRVHAEIDGDVIFPNWTVEDWRLVESKHYPVDERHAHAFTIEEWRR